MNFPILKKVHTVNVYPEIIHKETANYNVYVIKYELYEFIKSAKAKIIIQGKKNKEGRIYDYHVTFICPGQHIIKRKHSCYSSIRDLTCNMHEIMSDFKSFIELEQRASY